MALGGMLGPFRLIWRLLDGVRRVVHLFLMLLVLAAFLAVLASRPLKLPDAFVLVVSPEGELVEQYAGDPLTRSIDGARGLARSQTLLAEQVQAIEQAAGDRRVKAVHLDLNGFSGGSLDKLARLAAALRRFQEQGKPVVASAGGFGQPQYYLAAGADELYMDPFGGILWQGFGAYRPYFREALEKLSLDWYVFRTGEFKSFADAFIRDDMSAAEKQELATVLDGLWTAWRDHVAGGRGLESADLERYMDEFLPRLRAAGGDLAQLALDAGLVDGLWTADEVEQRLVELGGRDRDGSYSGVTAEEYLAVQLARPSVSKSGRPAVGLIVAQGDILPGHQPPGNIGDESLRDLLREAREDASVRALVLRVDSGGGSQFASEAIMRELELVRDEGKPVIVSMGGVAASGGYLVSLPADEIWAHPTTVTGSIGVVAAFPNFERLLKRLGVTVDGVGTHRLSGDFRFDRALGEEAHEIVELMVEGAYDRFLGQVAQARDLPRDELRQIADGRIWLGEAAYELGLVDRIGTLDEALDAAAERAGLGEHFRVRLIEAELGFRDSLMIRIFTGFARLGFTAWPKSWLERLPGELRGLAAEIERLGGSADPRGLYYHCLCPRL
jgi:protease IV